MPRHNCLKKKEVATSNASEATTASRSLTTATRTTTVSKSKTAGGRWGLGSGSGGNGGRQGHARAARLLVYAGGKCEPRALGGGMALAAGGLAVGGSRGG